MKIQKEESHDTEFKQSWRDDYLKWICAFSNTSGGSLYIGVEDNGNICGVENCHKLLEEGGLMVECPPCEEFLAAEKKKGKIVAKVDPVNGGQMGGQIVNGKVSRRLLKDLPSGGQMDDTVNDTVNGTVDGTVYGTVYGFELSMAEQAVLDAIMIAPSNSYEQFAKKCGLSRRTVARIIKNLQNKGLIQRIGSDRAGYWQIIKKDET